MLSPIHQQRPTVAVRHMKDQRPSVPIFSVYKARSACRILILLIVLLVLLTALNSEAHRQIMSLIFDQTEANGQEPIKIVKSPDGKSTLYRFKNGFVEVMRQESEYFNITPRIDLRAAYEALLLDLTAKCLAKRSFREHTANALAQNLCAVGRFKPRHQCFCLSFGLSGNVEFERELASNTECHVLVFDPSIKNEVLDGQRLLLFNAGLSDTYVRGDEKSASTDNLLGHLTRLNARGVAIDVLKIELGEREWIVLKRAVSDGSLKNVKQLVLKIRQEKYVSEIEYRSRIVTLRTLFRMGFHRWQPVNIENDWLDGSSLRYINIMFVLPEKKSFRRPLDSRNVETPKSALTSNGQPDPVQHQQTSGRTATSAQQSSAISKGPQFDHLEFIRNAKLSDLTATQLETMYFDLVEQQHIVCPDSQRIGDADDGGWDVCFTEPFDISKSKPCIAYSFGINYVWKYDDELVDVYNCRVYMFDPSMEMGDHQRLNTSWFFKIGLSATNGAAYNGWKMRTLCSLFDELGHSESTIDILKIDIEYWEWSAFETALKDGCMKRVKQLMFESHTSGMFLRRSDYGRFIRILRGLFDVGFMAWRWHMNPLSVFYRLERNHYRACCYEQYLLNTKFIAKAL